MYYRMGADNASAGMDQLARLNVDKIVNWGVVGALRDDVCSGDIVIPASVSDGSNVIRMHANWHHTLCSALAKQNRTFHTGGLVSTRAVISTVRDKCELAARTQCKFVDMECYAIAAKAARMNLDFLSVKSIADEVDTPVPPWVTRVIDNFGEPDIPGLVFHILRNPAQIRPFAKLVRSFNKAGNTLRSMRNDLFNAYFYHPDTV